MRTLSAYNTTETTNVITKPFFLVEIAFTVPVYYSTYKDFTYFSHNYDAGVKIEVGRITTAANGSSTGIMSIYDTSLMATIIGENYKDTTVTIYKGYGEAPIQADLELIFSGVIGGSSINSRKITLQLSSKGASAQVSPRTYIRAPDFNYLPGEQIVQFARAYR